MSSETNTNFDGFVKSPTMTHCPQYVLTDNWKNQNDFYDLNGFWGAEYLN
jgi:hypothetical protein